MHGHPGQFCTPSVAVILRIFRCKIMLVLHSGFAFSFKSYNDYMREFHQAPRMPMPSYGGPVSWPSSPVNIPLSSSVAST